MLSKVLRPSIWSPQPPSCKDSSLLLQVSVPSVSLPFHGFSLLYGLLAVSHNTREALLVLHLLGSVVF